MPAGKVKQFYSDLSVVAGGEGPSDAADPAASLPLLSKGGEFARAGPEREVLRETIFVNTPMRVGGLTMYQTDWSIAALQLRASGPGLGGSADVAGEGAGAASALAGVEAFNLPMASLEVFPLSLSRVCLPCSCCGLSAMRPSKPPPPARDPIPCRSFSRPFCSVYAYLPLLLRVRLNLKSELPRSLSTCFLNKCIALCCVAIRPPSADSVSLPQTRNDNELTSWDLNLFNRSHAAPLPTPSFFFFLLPAAICARFTLIKGISGRFWPPVGNLLAAAAGFFFCRRPRARPCSPWRAQRGGRRAAARRVDCGAGLSVRGALRLVRQVCGRAQARLRQAHRG